MIFEPLRDRLIVEVMKKDETTTTSSGLIIRETLEPVVEGVVLSIGSEVKDVSLDDKVMFRRSDGVHQKIEGHDCVILKENQVWAIIT